MSIPLDELRVHYVALGLSIGNDTRAAKRVGSGNRVFYVRECDGRSIQVLDTMGRPYRLAVADVRLAAVYDIHGKKCEYEVDDGHLLVRSKSKTNEWLKLFPWPAEAGRMTRQGRSARA